MTDETNMQPTDDEDTTGHGVRVKWVEPAGEDDTVDTEGHVIRSGRIQPDEGEDTEGHAFKFRP